SNMYVTEPPLPHKYAARVEPGGDATRVDRFHCFLPVGCLETFALRRQRAGPPNSRILSTGKMQTFRGFIFHAPTKGVAFDVVSQQRAKKNGQPTHGCDKEQNRNRSSVDQQFSLQYGKKLRKSKS